MALFRVDYSGRGELSERQQKVSHPEYSLRLGYRSCQLAQVHSAENSVYGALLFIKMTFRCCLSSRSCPKNIMSMVPKPHCQSKFIDDPKQIAILLTNQVQCINLLHCRNLASSHQSLFFSRSWCYNDIRGWRCSQTHWWPHPLTCFCHAPLSAKRFSMSACYYFHDL